MTDSSSKNSASVADAPASQAAPPPSGVDVTTMLLTALLAALIVGSALYGFRDFIAGYLEKQISGSDRTPRIVYVDSGKLFTGQLDRIMKKYKDEPAKGVFENRNFVNQLDTVLQKYTDAGYLVLTKQAVLRGIEGRDVTKPVMQSLGLDSSDESVPNIAR